MPKIFIESPPGLVIVCARRRITLQVPEIQQGLHQPIGRRSRDLGALSKILQAPLGMPNVETIQDPDALSSVSDIRVFGSLSDVQLLSGA